MPEQAVWIDGVPVASASAAAGQVTGSLQVGDDGLDGALGEADDGADVPHPGLWVAGDLDQDMPVTGQQCPVAAALARDGHTVRSYLREKIPGRRSTRETLHEMTLARENIRNFSRVLIDRLRPRRDPGEATEAALTTSGMVML